MSCVNIIRTLTTLLGVGVLSVTLGQPLGLGKNEPNPFSKALINKLTPSNIQGINPNFVQKPDSISLRSSIMELLGELLLTPRGSRSISANPAFQRRMDTMRQYNNNWRRSGRFIFPSDDSPSTENLAPNFGRSFGNYYPLGIRQMQIQQSNGEGRSIEDNNNNGVRFIPTRYGKVEAVPRPQASQLYEMKPGYFNDQQKFEISNQRQQRQLTPSMLTQTSFANTQNLALALKAHQQQPIEDFQGSPRDLASVEYLQKPYSQFESMQLSPPMTTETFVPSKGKVIYRNEYLNPAQSREQFSGISSMPSIRDGSYEVKAGYQFQGGNPVSNSQEQFKRDSSQEINKQNNPQMKEISSIFVSEAVPSSVVPSGPRFSRKLESSSELGVGLGSVEPSSNALTEITKSKEAPKTLPKVFKPSTIRSQALIVRDARDGRSLKQIEVQGVKIIVGAHTPDFPKH